jgi:hypothetical protein
MSRFTTALQTWITNRKDTVSIRQLAADANMESSALSFFRSGKRSITFDALGKLLPAIERHSTRTEALSLHVAYLLDEIVTGYETDLSITAVDPNTQAERADTIQTRATRWMKKARTDSDFEVMWSSLDGYFQASDDVIKDLVIDALAHEHATKSADPSSEAFPDLIPDHAAPFEESVAEVTGVANFSEVVVQKIHGIDPVSTAFLAQSPSGHSGAATGSTSAQSAHQTAAPSKRTASKSSSPDKT